MVNGLLPGYFHSGRAIASLLIKITQIAPGNSYFHFNMMGVKKLNRI